jgi:hypothetical protein
VKLIQPTTRRKLRDWYDRNEREIVLAVLALISGFQFGRVAGRHEK